MVSQKEKTEAEAAEEAEAKAKAEAEAKAEAKAEAGKKEVTLEGIFADLPIPDESKQALSNLFTNLVSTIAQTNERLAAIEAKPSEFNATKYEGSGLTAEQIYNIEIAKAQAPAAAASQQMWAALLGRGGGGGDQGGLGALVKSAEALNSLRDYLLPPPTAQQLALEAAQIDQIKAQTRLMDRVTGKKVEDFAAGKE